jgi:hypothetical protein
VSAMNAHAFMSGHMTNDASCLPPVGACLVAYLNDEGFLCLLVCLCC